MNRRKVDHRNAFDLHLYRSLEIVDGDSVPLTVVIAGHDRGHGHVVKISSEGQVLTRIEALEGLAAAAIGRVLNGDGKEGHRGRQSRGAAASSVLAREGQGVPAIRMRMRGAHD